MVVLVHGTFGRGVIPFRRFISKAGWIASSLLRQRLETKGFRVVEGPSWSGANTFKSRLACARELQAQIESLASGWQSSRVPTFLVAHSHGGTACLLALKNPDLAATVSGVVCLATPFPLVEPAALLLAPEAEAAYQLSTRFSLFVSAAVFSTLGAFMNVDYSALGAAIGGVVGAAICYFVLSLVDDFSAGNNRERRRSTSILRALRARAAGLVDEHGLPTSTAVPLLLIRGPGDEASSVLAACTFLNWSGRGLRRALSLTAGVALALVVGDGLVSEFHLRRLLEMPMPLGLFLVAFGLAALGSLILGICIVVAIATKAFVESLTLMPALLGKGLLAAPFGWDLLVDSLVISVSAEASPVGNHTVCQLGGVPIRGLSHALYNNHLAVDAVIEWLHRQCAQLGYELTPDRLPVLRSDEIRLPAGRRASGSEATIE